MLERLEDFVDRLSDEQREVLLQVLFDVGDKLEFERRGFFDMFAGFQVGRIINRCFKFISDEDARSDVLIKLITNGKSLLTVIQETSGAEPSTDERDSHIPDLISQEVWENVRVAALKRIYEAVNDGTIWKEKKLPYILFRWRDWEGLDPVRTAVSKYIVEDSNLIEFVGSFENVTYSQALGDIITREHSTVRREELEEFVDVEEVEQRLDKLKDSSLQNQSREALRLLRLIRAGDESDSF